MVEVYEIDFERARESAKNFKTTANSSHRFFIMEEEDSEVGFAAVGLEGKDVVVKEIITNKPFAYFDLLTRTALNVLKNLPSPIDIVIDNSIIDKQPQYFFRFGFKQINNRVVAKNIDIDLSGTCKCGCKGD